MNDDETLSNNEELEKELKRSKAITNVSNQIIQNANVVLKAKIHCDQFGDDLGEFLRLGEPKNK